MKSQEEESVDEAPEDLPSLIRDSKCAVMLGITVKTLRRLRLFAMYPLPFYRAGEGYRYDPKEVMQWAKDEAKRDPSRKIRKKHSWERSPSEIAQDEK